MSASRDDYLSPEARDVIASAKALAPRLVGVIGVHNWQLPLFPEQAQQDVWGSNSATLIGSTYMPVGCAETVDGGWQLSGRWGFSSGVDHCDWIFLGGLLPRKDGSPGVEHTTFLLPKSDFRIERNWDVLGLRATGSQPGWLYRVPFIQVFQPWRKGAGRNTSAAAPAHHVLGITTLQKATPDEGAQDAPAQGGLYVCYDRLVDCTGRVGLDRMLDQFLAWMG